MAYEYVDDMPDFQHWKPVMEFSIEWASLLMAGIDPADLDSIAVAKAWPHPRWKKAYVNSIAIVSAIRQGLISPVVCRGFIDNWEHGSTLATTKPTDREAEISIEHTIITRASLVNWISTSDALVVTARPKQQIAKAMQPTDSINIIEAKPEPLALPYHGHTSDGLDYVDDAIKQFWTTVDPEDPTTVPLKKDVVDYLITKRGASKNIAEAVDKILRPENMRRVHLKNGKVPTRESQ